MDDGARRPQRGRRATAGFGCTARLHAIAVAAAMALCTASVPARALTVQPTFDSSITGSAQANGIENAINGALGFYNKFVDPVAASVDFQLAPPAATYLGASLSTYYFSNYGDYTSSLLSDASAYGNAPELKAYGHLGAGNSADLILATSVDYRALNFVGAPGLYSADGSFNVGGSFDGIVYLNARDLAGFGGSYDANRVIQHEVDEVLGIGGSGSILNLVQQNGLSTPPVDGGSTFIGALDLFRYSSAGHRSLTTSGSAASYFSIDGGVTHIAPFNQNSGGDYADWGGNGCIASVQQAFSCASQTASLSIGSPEVTALQVIGYDLPEPADLAVFACAMAGLGVARRLRRAPGAGVT